MSGTVFAPAFSLAYQKSPILLTGGLAATIGNSIGSAVGGNIGGALSAAVGGALPLITFLEGASLLGNLLAGSLPTNSFADFLVIPSSKLISQQIGHYPFANQNVAANAVIAEPLTVSVRMDCPAGGPGTYVAKLAVLTALQAALTSHNASGGLYTILTPSFIYTNCIMTALTDVSGAGSNQVQYQWMFDFEQPLVTLAAAQQAYSSLMNKIASGTQVTDAVPAWTSPGNAGPAVPVSSGFGSGP
jgi:hypothetical protein